MFQTAYSYILFLWLRSFWKPIRWFKIRKSHLKERVDSLSKELNDLKFGA